MKLSQQSQAIIESAIQKAINKYTCGCEQTIVTDIHIQPNQNSGELFIYDDEDEELSSVTIDEWTAYEGDDFYEDAERIFRTMLCRMKEGGSFDKLTILKPYSFVLVDEDKETISDLLLVDDDTLLVNDELLKGLDKELDDFLKNGDFTGLKNVFENALYLSRDKTDGDKMDKEFFWFNMETRQEKLFFTITDADEVSSSSVAVLREGEYVITFDTWNTGDISILYKEKESKSHLLYN